MYILCGRSLQASQQTVLTSSFSRLFHAVLVYVQRKQHVRVPVFFFGGVGALAAVASGDGCVQKPGCLLGGGSSQLRLVLELETARREERNQVTGCCPRGGISEGRVGKQE